MKDSRTKLIIKYVLPTILSQCAFFLFTIIDGIFVGHGVGADGLVAVNILRGLILTPLSVVALSFLTNGTLFWFTVGIAEALTFISAMVITKRSERNGVTFETD